MSFQVKYIYDLVDKMSPQLQKIQASVNQTTAAVEKSARTMSTSFSNMGNSIKNVSSGIRNAGTALAPMSVGIGAAGVMALKSTANFETLQMQMEVLTGSAEKGKEVFDKLVKLGAETPFELKDLAKANNTLMGYGQTAEQAFHQIQLIGDISAVSGGDLQGITVAFGQAAASGRLMGQDLLQLVNNGVPIIDMLAKTMKKPKEAIKEMVSQGAVTFPVLLKAFEDATGKGGRFEGGMEKLSKTLGGLYSTLKDNLNIGLAEFGKEIVTVLNVKENMKEFNATLAKMTDSFKALSPETKKFILYVGLTLTVLAPLLVVIGLIGGGIATLVTGIGALSAAFAFLAANPIVLLIGAMVLLYNTWNDFAVIVDYVASIIGSAFKSDGIHQFITDLTTVLGLLTDIAGFFLKYPKMFGNFVADKINANLDAQAGIGQPIQPQPVVPRENYNIGGGVLDINMRGQTSGVTANYTKIPNSNLDVGKLGFGGI